MNKNINKILESLQDLDAFSDELERLEGEENEKGLWDSTRPYSDVYAGSNLWITIYHPNDKYELEEIIKKLVRKANPNHLNKPTFVDLNHISVSKITDMSGLFKDYIFNDVLNVDVSRWDVSNVEDMNHMFFECERFDCDLSRWDVSNVEDMSYMFCGCTSFTGEGLEKWDVSNVEDMDHAFCDCTSFNPINLSNWNISNVYNMDSTFKNCSSFEGVGLSRWDLSKVPILIDPFEGCKFWK